MTTLKNINTFRFGWISHFQDMMDTRVNDALRAWEHEDLDDYGGSSSERFFNRAQSNSSASAYWTAGSDEIDALCVRVSDHPCVNCCSAVHHNVNLMDFITIEKDPDGFQEDDEWFIDMDEATKAIKDAADQILNHIQ